MDQKAGKGCFSGPSKNLLAQCKAELMLAALSQGFTEIPLHALTVHSSPP
jgi:hypothetical protein